MNAVRRCVAILSNHMLLDLYMLFISIRRNPLLLPADAYQELAELLDTTDNHNAIRVVLRKYIPAEQTPPELDFMDTDNKYATCFWCKAKGKETAAFVRWTLLHFQQLAAERVAAKIEDFADAVHFLPLVAYQQPTCRIERKLRWRVMWRYREKWRGFRRV